MLVDKDDLFVLRIAAALWLNDNPAHKNASAVAESLNRTNTPTPFGRRPISDELQDQIIASIREGNSLSETAHRLGLSHPTVSKYWRAYRKTNKSV